MRQKIVFLVNSWIKMFVNMFYNSNINWYDYKSHFIVAWELRATVGNLRTADQLRFVKIAHILPMRILEEMKKCIFTLKKTFRSKTFLRKSNDWIRNEALFSWALQNRSKTTSKLNLKIPKVRANEGDANKLNNLGGYCQ